MALLQWLTQADIPQVLLVFLIALLVILFSKRLLEDLRAPPGPWGLPIVGYQPFLDQSRLTEQFQELSEKYGDVFSFRCGRRLMIVLSSFQSIKDTIVRQSDIFSGKQDGFNVIKWFGNDINVFVVDGESWRDQRRFLLTTLRDFGFAKLSLEGVLHEEAEALKTTLSDSNGKPQEISFLMSKVAANIICHLLFGRRFEYDEGKLEKLLELNDRISRTFNFFQYKDNLPLIRHLPASWTGMDVLTDLKDAFYGFIDDRITDHEETFDANNLRDLIDVYLKKIQESKENQTDKLNNYTREHMRANAVSLFGAGTDTISNTMMWAFKFMLVYPEIQKRIQEEIESAIGRSRLPSWTDRPNLSYLEATINEVLRYSSIIPVNFPRCNLEEVQLNGYTIPKRSSILANFKKIHYDPTLWKNPEEFNPSRFLDKNGKCVKPEYLLGFSAGGRVCLGESLARMELLIFLATILQNFNLLPPEGEKVSVDITGKLIKKLDRFKIRMVLRT